MANFIWYELMTTDVEAAERFYGSVVGWRFGESMPGDVDYRMIMRSDGGNSGGVLHLSKAMVEGGARPGWLGYLPTANVDALAEETERAGGKVHMPPSDMEGVGRIAMVSDPQGAPLYVMKPTPPEGTSGDGSSVFSVDRAQHVRWNELMTADPDAALAYYIRHFGWRQEGAMEMGALGQYQFLYSGDTMIGAVMPLLPGAPASSWTFYIGVSDIDRAAEAVRGGGGTILQEPIRIPGGEYSLTALDPQGAVFGLVGPRLS